MSQTASDKALSRAERETDKEREKEREREKVDAHTVTFYRDCTGASGRLSHASACVCFFPRSIRAACFSASANNAIFFTPHLPPPPPPLYIRVRSEKGSREISRLNTSPNLPLAMTYRFLRSRGKFWRKILISRILGEKCGSFYPKVLPSLRVCT